MTLPRAQHLGVFQLNLPDDIINTVRQQCKDSPNRIVEAKMLGGKDSEHRKAYVKGINTFEWFAGMLWYYVARANRENFCYDITCIENESLNYLMYPEGNYYKWHQDTDVHQHFRLNTVPDVGKFTIDQQLQIDHQWVRKLSFSLQLSDPSEYDGGELQFHNCNHSISGVISAPRDKGALIIFDSRLPHRVKKVTRGTRESLVGWVLGPHWK